MPLGSIPIDRNATLLGTVVGDLRWEGAEYPGSKRGRNFVHIPELGNVFFGELRISRDARRLTMLRLELGSWGGGSGGGPEVDANGGWSP
jgi:hypothetical protein